MELTEGKKSDNTGWRGFGKGPFLHGSSGGLRKRDCLENNGAISVKLVLLDSAILLLSIFLNRYTHVCKMPHRHIFPEEQFAIVKKKGSTKVSFEKRLVPMQILSASNPRTEMGTFS